MCYRDEILRASAPITAALKVVDAGDLRALAAIHTQFQELGLLATNAGALDVAEQSREMADRVEAVLLGDVPDKSIEIRSIVRDLECLLSSEGQADPAAAEVASSGEQPTPPVEGGADGEPLVENPIGEADAPLAQEFIIEAEGHLESAEAALLGLESSPDDESLLASVFRSFHTIKGVAGFLNLRQIGALAHAAETLLDLARKGETRLAGRALDVTLEALDLLRRLVADLKGAVERGDAPPVSAELPDLLERLKGCASGEESAPPHREPASQTPAETRPRPQEDRRASSGESVVKVNTERLDSLINMVGELSIAQAMVEQGALAWTGKTAALGRSLAHLGKITRDLQDLSMSMRMVPIQGVFQKMARLVRDVARKAGKEVELVSIGGETELDRNLVDSISDPLIHMVRNAVDHGIEAPEDRTDSGKPRSGRVELRAFHLAGNIVVQISDDGKGLSRDRILGKARDAGLISDGRELSDQEVFAFIFHPGLSTADRITDVSGRGVGMDVVKRNVEALRGRIEITSELGKGSTFTIRLPLTLAMIDGMVVKVGDARFIIPTTSIEQSLRPKPEQISTVQGRGELCMVRGALLPLYRMSHVFGLPAATDDPASALTVILQDNARRCCMLVDELLGQQQVVIKTLGDGIGNVPGVSGAAILGDGNVSLIIDVPGLIDLAERAESRIGSCPTPGPRRFVEQASVQTLTA